MLTTARSVPYVLRKEMRRAEKLNETAPLFKLQLQLNAPPSKRYLRGDSDAGHLLREPLEYQLIKTPRPATNMRCGSHRSTRALEDASACIWPTTTPIPSPSCHG